MILILTIQILLLLLIIMMMPHGDRHPVGFALIRAVVGMPFIPTPMPQFGYFVVCPHSGSCRCWHVNSNTSSTSIVRSTIIVVLA